MKRKARLTVATAAVAAVAAVLRLLQYIYLIDENGRMVTAGLADTVLKYSVNAVIIGCVIFATVIYFAHRKSVASAKSCSGGKFSAALCVIITALAATEGGIGIGAAVKSGKVDAFGLALGILSVFSAVYFAVLAVSILKGVKFAAEGILGIFPPVFAVAKCMELFFTSFKSVGKSELRLETVAVCALALFLSTFVSVRNGVLVRVSRLKTVTFLFAVVSGAFALPALYNTVSQGGATMDMLPRALWPMQMFILSVFALVCMIRAELVPPAPPAVNKEPDLSALEIFINEIPEQNEEE